MQTEKLLFKSLRLKDCAKSAVYKKPSRHQKQTGIVNAENFLYLKMIEKEKLCDRKLAFPEKLFDTIYEQKEILLETTLRE